MPFIQSAQIISEPAPTNSSTSSAETQQEMAVTERGSISMPAEDAGACGVGVASRDSVMSKLSFLRQGNGVSEAGSR
jgi:hypothetical protein